MLGLFAVTGRWTWPTKAIGYGVIGILLSIIVPFILSLAELDGFRFHYGLWSFRPGWPLEYIVLEGYGDSRVERSVIGRLVLSVALWSAAAVNCRVAWRRYLAGVRSRCGRCGGCGFDLRGNRWSTVCPECGDPNDLSGPAERRRCSRIATAGGVILLILNLNLLGILSIHCDLEAPWRVDSQHRGTDVISRTRWSVRTWRTRGIAIASTSLVNRHPIGADTPRETWVIASVGWPREWLTLESAVFSCNRCSLHTSEASHVLALGRAARLGCDGRNWVHRQGLLTTVAIGALVAVATAGLPARAPRRRSHGKHSGHATASRRASSTHRHIR